LHTTIHFVTDRQTDGQTDRQTDDILRVSTIAKNPTPADGSAILRRGKTKNSNPPECWPNERKHIVRTAIIAIHIL